VSVDADFLVPFVIYSQNVSRSFALKALQRSNGDPAEAGEYLFANIRSVSAVLFDRVRC
jgi:hypothetical protein